MKVNCVYFIIVDIFIKSTLSKEVDEFMVLLPRNFMPPEAELILEAGFPVGFLADYRLGGVSAIARAKAMIYPVVWYNEPAMYNNNITLKNECRFAQTNIFNCFGFNSFISEFKSQNQLSKLGMPHLELTKTQLALNFIYHYCRNFKLINPKSQQLYDTRNYCPNPCYNKTIFCQNIEHGLYGQCIVDSKYPFRIDGFACVCVRGYKWSTTLKLCIQENLDFNAISGTCSRAGTQQIKTIKLQIICLCKFNYQGDQCQIMKDPCKYSMVNGNPTGNTACNINQGRNVCKSVYPQADSGRAFYYCQCSTDDHFQRNYSIRYDNCLIRSKPCEILRCKHGTCVSTVISQPGQCICDHGWTGSDCSILKPTIDQVFTVWTDWSVCKPSRCGENRLRYRFRSCLQLIGCYNNHDLNNDLRPCRPRACNRYYHPTYRDIFIRDVQISDNHRLESEYIIYAFIIWIVLNMILIAVAVQYRFFQPFIKLMSRMKAVPNIEITEDLDHLQTLESKNQSDEEVGNDEASNVSVSLNKSPSDISEDNISAKNTDNEEPPIRISFRKT